MLLGSGTKERGGALLGYRSPGVGGRSSDSEGSDGPAGSSLAVGWEYTGPVCSVADLAAADLADVSADVADSFGRAAPELGEVWECPLLARLPGGAGSNGSSNGGSANSGSRISAEEAPWLLAVSPYPAKPPNAPSNPVLYWIGRLSSDGTRFELPRDLPARLRPARCCRYERSRLLSRANRWHGPHARYCISPCFGTGPSPCVAAPAHQPMLPPLNPVLA